MLSFDVLRHYCTERPVFASKLSYNAVVVDWCVINSLRRYEEDGAVAKKIPITIEEASIGEEDSQDEENGGGPRRGRRRMRRLLKDGHGCGGLPDPVLSTLSVNRNLG